jgi:hypothetical protein
LEHCDVLHSRAHGTLAIERVGREPQRILIGPAYAGHHQHRLGLVASRHTNDLVTPDMMTRRRRVSRLQHNAHRPVMCASHHEHSRTLNLRSTTWADLPGSVVQAERSCRKTEFGPAPVDPEHAKALCVVMLVVLFTGGTAKNWTDPAMANAGAVKGPKKERNFGGIRMFSSSFIVYYPENCPSS